MIKKRNGSDVGEPRPAQRLTMLRGTSALVRGKGTAHWGDLFYVPLTIPWWAFLGLTALAFVGVNSAFALLYLLDPEGVEHARPGSFSDAFFFSVQTLGTLGYGTMWPKSFYANVIVTLETFVSLANLAIGAGLIYARFSRPTSRILFSRIAVVTPFEDVPTLMFRAANQRGNQILDADATVTLVRNITTREGHAMRRFEELPLTRSRTPLFALSWTMLHPIDENSPLYRLTRDALLESGAELLVVLSGTDETISHRIYARHSYLADEIVWNRRFADILSTASDGRPVIDYTQFLELARE